MQTQCPNCKKTLTLPDEYFCKTIKCKSCNKSFTAEPLIDPPKPPNPPSPPKPSPTKTGYTRHPVTFLLNIMGGLIIILSVLAGLGSESFFPFFLGFSLAMFLLCFAIIIDYLAEIAFYLKRNYR